MNQTTSTEAPHWPTAHQSLHTLNGILALDRVTAYAVADVLGVGATRPLPDRLGTAVGARG